jgi:hypothetical protein
MSKSAEKLQNGAGGIRQDCRVTWVGFSDFLALKLPVYQCNGHSFRKDDSVTVDTFNQKVLKLTTRLLFPYENGWSNYRLFLRVLSLRLRSG